MSRKTRFGFFLLIICLPVLATAAPGGVGYLSVRLVPGNYAYIDSHLVADQSFTGLALSPGAYLLHVFDPTRFSWQDRGILRQVTIQQAETVLVDLQNDDRLRISSDPPGGTVLVDGLPLGPTPLILSATYQENKPFTISKSGYQDLTFFREPGVTNYTFTLKPAAQVPDLGAGRYKDSDNQLRWLHEGLVITSLAGSWLSFLFKRQADANYNKYLHTARPNDLKKYYDRTVRFDRYTEISMGISLVALGGYIYTLLTE